MEINLENPIFALYVNINNLTNSKAEVLLSKYSENFGKYKNITTWIFPSKEDTRIELIWSGSKYQKPIDSNTKNLVEHVNKVLDLLSNGTTDGAIKAGLRDLQLSKILD